MGEIVIVDFSLVRPSSRTRLRTPRAQREEIDHIMEIFKILSQDTMKWRMNVETCTHTPSCDASAER